MPDGVIDYNPSTHIFTISEGSLPKFTCGDQMVIECTKEGYTLSADTAKYHTYPVPDIQSEDFLVEGGVVTYLTDEMELQ